MKTAVFVIVCLLVMVGVGAFVLHQKGLLSLDVLRLYLPKKEAQKKTAKPAPIGTALSLQEKERQLEQRYEETEQLGRRLKLEKEELSQAQEKIDEQLRILGKKPESGPEAAGEGEGTEDLVKIYEGMDPDEAAAILENMPDDTAADILLQMRKREAARVMESLSTAKGVAVSERILPEQIEKKTD